LAFVWLSAIARQAFHPAEMVAEREKRKQKYNEKNIYTKALNRKLEVYLTENHV
jgi:hypothetical protein